MRPLQSDADRATECFSSARIGNLGAPGQRSSGTSDAFPRRPPRGSRRRARRASSPLAGTRVAARRRPPARGGRTRGRRGGAPHPARGGFVARRLDRTVASGLLLTLALAVTLPRRRSLLGVLALLVRRVASIQHVDNSVAAWGYDHRSAASTRGLQVITDLGSIQIVVGLAVVLVLVDLYRHRNRWSFLFLLVVLAGMELVAAGVKDLVGRLRPDARPGGGDARAVVPERPLGDRGGVLRRSGSGHRPLAAAAARGTSRSRPPSRSRSRSPGAACCSTCTGSPTSSAGSRSAGPGSRSAPSSSADACSGRRPRPKSPRTRRRHPHRASARRALQQSVPGRGTHR